MADIIRDLLGITVGSPFHTPPGSGASPAKPASVYDGIGAKRVGNAQSFGPFSIIDRRLFGVVHHEHLDGRPAPFGGNAPSTRPFCNISRSCSSPTALAFGVEPYTSNSAGPAAVCAKAAKTLTIKILIPSFCTRIRLPSGAYKTPSASPQRTCVLHIDADGGENLQTKSPKSYVFGIFPAPEIRRAATVCDGIRKWRLVIG
jgi:hypothetical protein